jgi:hypothetical protein
MSFVNEIIDKVGTKRLCICLGVRPTAISNAKTAVVFPARWFFVIRGLAAEVGVDVEGREFLGDFTFIGVTDEALDGAASNRDEVAT